MEAYFGLEKPVVRPLRVVGVVRVVFIFTTTRTTETTLIKQYLQNSTYGLIDDEDKGKRLYLGRRVEPAKSSRCAGAEPAR